MLGFNYCTGAVPSCGEQRLLSGCGSWASHCGGFLRSSGSGVMTPGLTCSVACGEMFPEGSNPWPLHWQADSYQWDHQESPESTAFNTACYLVNVLVAACVRACVHACVRACVRSVRSPFSRVQLFVTLWTVPRQVSLSMGFSRQEVSRHDLFQEIFPAPGIRSVSLPSPALAGGLFISSATWEAQ